MLQFHFSDFDVWLTTEQINKYDTETVQATPLR